MSYGETTDVAAYVPRFAATTGDFNTTTNPTKTRVTSMITRISAVIDSYLSSLGFSTPLTTTDGVNAMKELVIEYVAELVEGVNGSSRFAPGSKAIAGQSKWTVINTELMSYLDAIATGLENFGEARTGERQMGTSTVIRVDAYSDDLNNLESDIT